MRVLASLALTTAAAILPVALYAAEPMIQDDDHLTLNFGFDVQTRAETAFAHNSNGQSYDINRGEIGKSDEIQCSMRRARLLMDGSYGPNWKFFLGFLDDNVDRNYYNQSNTAVASTSGGGREVALYKAYMKRIVPLTEDGTNISFQAGMDYPYWNRAIIGDPNWLFAQQRASGNYMGNRGVGGRFMASGNMFDFAIDVQEGLDANRGSGAGSTPGNATTNPAGNGGQVEGMFYSTRLEVWAFNNNDKKPTYRESYKGAEGHSLLVAVDAALDNRNYQIAATKTNTEGLGAEALLHWDGLSALTEARFINVHQDSTGAAGGINGKDNANVYIAQAGYTIPVMGIRMEPALRFSWIDNNVGNRSTIGAYNGGTVATGTNGTTAMNIPSGDLQNGAGNPDGLNSGKMYDVGLNFYFNRVMGAQLSYSYWHAKTGIANANIIRSQWQVQF